jgi:hypothetical protein
MGRTSDSRKRLIDAGHDLIWATSYGSVTIEAICDREPWPRSGLCYGLTTAATKRILLNDQATDVVGRQRES